MFRKSSAVRTRKPRVLSIRAKVTSLSVAWVAGLAVVATASVFALKMTTDLQDTATASEALRQEAADVRGLAFELMANEKVFILAPTADGATRIGNLLVATREAAAGLDASASRLGVATEDAGKLAGMVEELAAKFGELSAKQSAIGLTDDAGLRAELGTTFAALRTEFNKVSKSGQNPDTVRVAQAFAQLNQARAEFLYAHDQISAGGFDAAVGRFGRELDKTPLDDAVKARLKDLVATHGAAFARYGEAYDAWLRTADQSSLAFDLIAPLTRSIDTAAAALADKAGSELDKGTTLAIRFLTVAIPAAILAGLIASWLIGRSITRPLEAIRSAMERLARGDLATVSGTDRPDEIGAMARTLAVFQESEIAKSRLEAAQREEVERRQERQVAFDAAVHDFRAAAEQLTGTVSSTMNGMVDTARRMLADAETSHARARQVADASTGVSDKVTLVAGAAEELAASITEISGHVQRTTAVIGTATDGARHTNEQVAALSEAASRVGQVVTLIRTIAEQTNLLALNATIEAARAGEAGRGFAVVASEVKQLADQTAKATEQIGQQIAEMQSSTGDAVSSIRSIAATMEDVNAATMNIASAVEEQEASTAEISRGVADASSNTRTLTQNVDHVVDAIGSTSDTARKVQSAAETVIAQAGELERVIETFLGRVAA
jgi:methyl-accepting chemotaxis protein